MSTLLVGLPQGAELIVILLVVLLLFGARKLPELARSLGASAKEFRKGLDEGATEADMNGKTPPSDT